eukprot:CAMPEP_0201121882 /NCGR_PEP_ID=MMETSP0850-20130426/5653_1 /ASSEMBLY_ACC=CAM_ASM_000622 /TAXON_ID=183588 /ORGANISM="Pseudo-nitzschia fraudulenta, Strain WWA7" /LENGTH=273 /DNA_ID=CAMNT_0047388439 /DNA_START=52 /DNA_END=873 /DNA_ORIENTATION=+
MYSVYRSSVFSIASTASRRVYHSSIRSLKASVNGPKPATAKPTNVQSATADPSKAKRAASSSSSSSSSSSFAKENPFVFQLGVATAKTSAADLVAQIVAEKKSLDEVDWKRNFIFVVFGFAYLGAFQYWLMVNKFRQWFPTMDRFAKLSFADKLKDKAGIIDAAKMVVFDVTVHLPMIYFPTYYTVKEFVGGKTWNPADWAMDGVSKYVNNAKDDLTAMIKLWGPSDCIQFVLPMHIRLPFRHLVSFFWTAYVSFTRGSLEDGSSEEEQAQEA